MKQQSPETNHHMKWNTETRDEQRGGTDHGDKTPAPPQETSGNGSRESCARPLPETWGEHDVTLQPARHESKHSSTEGREGARLRLHVLTGWSEHSVCMSLSAAPGQQREHEHLEIMCRHQGPRREELSWGGFFMVFSLGLKIGYIHISIHIISIDR